MTKDDIKYEVIKELGTIAELKNGYAIKLRLLSWNDGEPKYDIRTWATDDNGNEKCYKGIGLTKDQLKELGKLIGKIK